MVGQLNLSVPSIQLLYHVQEVMNRHAHRWWKISFCFVMECLSESRLVGAIRVLSRSFDRDPPVAMIDGRNCYSSGAICWIIVHGLRMLGSSDMPGWQLWSEPKADLGRSPEVSYSQVRKASRQADSWSARPNLINRYSRSSIFSPPAISKSDTLECSNPALETQNSVTIRY